MWRWVNNYRQTDKCSQQLEFYYWIWLLRILMNHTLKSISATAPSVLTRICNRECWHALSLNWIMSSADYNHVDLKNSMTVALDFYTLFKHYIHTICSGLTVFLILHVHANEKHMRYVTLYKCSQFVLWCPWLGLGAAGEIPSVYF